MTQPEPRPIMLLTGGPVTQTLWAPLAERYDLVFLYPAAAQQAAALGLTAAPIAALMDGDIQEHIANEAVMLSARVVAGLPNVSTCIGAAYEDTAPAALNGHLHEWFPGYIHHLLTAEIALLAQLERLSASGRRIVGCITHEDVSPEPRTLINWANVKGIPTIHVPHAPCHLLPGVVDIHRETRAKWIAASGPAVAEFYSASGHDSSFITVTGGPQYDWMYTDAPTRTRAREILLGDDLPKYAGKPMLCYQTTWGQTTSLRSEFETEFTQGWQAVLAVAKEIGAFVMVKVHWNDTRPETLERYDSDLRAAGVPGLVTRDHMLYVLAAADCLVAQGPSNMCLEAAMVGTPSAYIQTADFDFTTPLPYRGTAETIGAAIRAALDSAGRDEWQDFVSQYNDAHPEGDATSRVVAMVEQICQ